MQVDYLIVGQGICGTFLSRYLLDAGCTIRVIDQPNRDSASQVASGIINPITGRRLVRTWEIEKFLPFAREAYSEMSQLLDQPLIREMSVLEFPTTVQMKHAFENRTLTETFVRYPLQNTLWKESFNSIFEPGEIAPALLISINHLLSGWRVALQKRNLIESSLLSWDEIQHEPTGIRYGDIKAKKIIFCDGVNSENNPYFKKLPFAPNKGEVIWARIPELSDQYIYKAGITLVPWEKDIWWIGSTYEWDFTDALPTEKFRDRVTTYLQQWLKLPFEILDHRASIRPANLERRPFVGLHPTNDKVGILNGMGTKGCSLAPFFAEQFTSHILQQTAIDIEASIDRFNILATK
ncbi:MAG: FAD-dependent oxidoreductase [Sediminibacterium sp.]|nr:FAD-dependent oxidoreductase [Sediminibacterium sp.]